METDEIILEEGQDMSEMLLQTNETIAEEKKNAGNEQYKAQNYEQAVTLYSDAISLCPSMAAYYGNRAACYLMLGDHKGAIGDCRLAIQIDEKFEKGYVRLVKSYIAIGDVVSAEQAVAKFLSLDTKSLVLASEIENLKRLRAFQEKADQCIEKADLRTAIFQIDNALKIAPYSQRLKLQKAESLAQLGRIEEANTIAISVMQSDSSSSDAIYVRGVCLYYSDSLDKSLLHFERALMLDPDNKRAKVMRIKTKSLKEKKEKGNELFKTGKFREALAQYTEALAIDTLNKDVNSKLYYNRALVGSKIGNLRDAIADCSNALEANAAYLKAVLLRAKCHTELQNYEDAVKDYEHASKTEKTPHMRSLLREAKMQLKRSKRKDYYKILGLNRDATDDDIKKAYRKRALVHHPDRHANASDAEKKEQEKKFKEIGEAYTILSDPEKKSRYDNGQDMDEDHSMEVDPNQMFRQFFSFSGQDNSFGFSF